MDELFKYLNTQFVRSSLFQEQVSLIKDFIASISPGEISVDMVNNFINSIVPKNSDEGRMLRKMVKDMIKEQKKIEKEKLRKAKKDMSERSEKSGEGHIYLLHEREFLNKGEHTYKIGHTTQKLLTRISQYPKGSRLIYSSIVTDSKQKEDILIRLFDQKFTNRPEYGREYYFGDPKEMVRVISNNIT